MRFRSDDGLCESSDPSFVQVWNNVVNQRNSEKTDWISNLRAAGIKAAHPDDGWVDRTENRVAFAYPQFDDGADVGDMVALGWPDRFRLVKVTEVLKRPDRYASYLFEPVIMPPIGRRAKLWLWIKAKFSKCRT